MVTLHHGNVAVEYIQYSLLNEINISNYQSRNADLYALNFCLFILVWNIKNKFLLENVDTHVTCVNGCGCQYL